MRKEIADYNASMIYDCPNSVFIADAEGQLNTISKFNLLGRLIEWFRDLVSGWERSQHTDKAIIDTLNSILEYLKTGASDSFYIQDNDRLLFPSLDIPVFYNQIHLYQYNHPVDKFSDRIMNSSLGNKPGISQIAEQMKEIALPIIQSLSAKQKEDLFNAPFNV